MLYLERLLYFASHTKYTMSHMAACTWLNLMMPFNFAWSIKSIEKKIE